MEEYMTREQAIEVLNRDDESMRGGWFCLNDFTAIDVLKTADVVERSKVNKAIEEIRKLSPTPTVNDVIEGNPEKDEIWAVLVEVLEILKRNLGDD